MIRQKTVLYKQLKVASVLCLVPFILGLGPFSGFYLGAYLQKTFNLPSWVIPWSVIVGILAAVRETLRIITMAIRIGE